MNAKPILFITLSILVVAGAALSNLRTVAAVSVVGVNLDANSTSQTDIINSTDPSPAKSFRIGAIINTTTSGPISNIYGWQFTINYNASAFVPQGDPDPSSTYPDGAANTVLFGAQTTAGTASWAGLVAASKAFGSSSVSSSGSNGQITVFLTIIAPTPAVSLSAKTLLANVQFELLNRPSTSQQFAITNVLFVDSTGATIPNISSGTGATETVTNAPPFARFTHTAPPKVAPFKISFDATSSSDSDGTITNPTNYFWDFGDGTQDLGTTGSVLDHTYSTTGQYNVTLRVVDNLGATGSARDALGNVIVNSPTHSQPSQPSHTFETISWPFVLNANSSAPYQPGGTVRSLIIISSFGFSGNINMAAAVNPPVSGASPPTIINSTVVLQLGGSNSSLVTVTFPSATPLLSYNLTVTATSGSQSTSLNITLLPTTVRIDPVLVTGLTKGGTFTANVAASVARAISWQFTLHYDPALLSTTFRSVSFGPFWQAALNSNLGFPVIALNQTTGTLTVAFTLLANGNSPPTPFTGNATLASTIFTVNAYDNSSLHLSPGDIIFVDPLQQSIPVSRVTDGLFDNRLPHDVAVTSVSVLPTTITAGGSVGVTVVVKNKGLNAETTSVAVTDGATSIGQQQVSINPGELKTLSFTWVVPSSTSGTISIQAQATISTGDGDGSDNTLSTKLKVNPQPVVHTPDSTSSYLLYGGAGAAAAIIAVAAFLFVRRRRTPSPAV